MVKILLEESNVDPNEEDHNRFTALHHSAQLRNKTTANLLLLYADSLKLKSKMEIKDITGRISEAT